MNIVQKEVSVKDVFEGYVDKDEEGVFGYGGHLTIRPSYQREFIYNKEQSQKVIYTILNNFPLNIMYWIKTGDNSYEVLDGQQRTLSIMHFLRHQFSIKINGFTYYENSLPQDKKDQILNYKLTIYVCDGSETEKLEWFDVVNIAGATLTKQEKNNSVYTGSWLQDAKLHFSKKNCVAKKISDRYITGNPNRQELLEKALKGICEYKGLSDVTQYMAEHRHDASSDELRRYFKTVIDWIEATFPDYYPDMKGLDWCHLYNKFCKQTYYPERMREDVKKLHEDEEVQKQKGIYEYLLSKDEDPFAERLLSLRTFTKLDKRKAYARQAGICPICKKHFELDEMEGDHIKPWSKGGLTELENCQMLCKDCNRKKSNC